MVKGVPRLLAGGQRFEGLGPDAMTTSEFVDLILEQADELFPGYSAVRFERPHVYEQDEAIPSVALISHDLTQWWVGVAHVSDQLEDAVLPVVSILRRTTYGILDAEMIVARSNLDSDAVIRLTREEQPGVLVIVSTLHLDWVVPLQGDEAIVTFLEVFESMNGARMLRVNGEQPSASGSVLSTCHIDPASPRLVVVADPATLGDQDEFLIDYAGGADRWIRTTVPGTGTCLYSASSNRLPPGTPLELRQFQNGRLAFLLTEGTV